MGKKLTDSCIGQKYGRLTIVQVPFPSKDSWVHCHCECGNKYFITAAARLHCSNTKSCGCIKKEWGMNHTKTHGMTHTGEYRSWLAMWTRCTNPKANNYYLYGGRGIIVCERWKTFANFFADMGAKPEKGFSLDRLDSNGNYEPGNCCWSSPKEQSRNRRPQVAHRAIEILPAGSLEWIGW